MASVQSLPFWRETRRKTIHVRQTIVIERSRFRHRDLLRYPTKSSNMSPLIVSKVHRPEKVARIVLSTGTADRAEVESVGRTEKVADQFQIEDGRRYRATDHRTVAELARPVSTHAQFISSDDRGKK